jgi:hypothetical protein
VQKQPYHLPVLRTEMLTGSLDAILSCLGGDKEYDSRSFPFAETLIAFRWFNAVNQALYSHVLMILHRRHFLIRASILQPLY